MEAKGVVLCGEEGRSWGRCVPFEVMWAHPKGCQIVRERILSEEGARPEIANAMHSKRMTGERGGNRVCGVEETVSVV